MLQNAYLLAKIGADTAENEQHFAEILPTDDFAIDRAGIYDLWGSKGGVTLRECVEAPRPLARLDARLDFLMFRFLFARSLEQKWTSMHCDVCKMFRKYDYRRRRRRV